jgi:hypothetical protein
VKSVKNGRDNLTNWTSFEQIGTYWNTFEHVEKSKERLEMPPIYFICNFAPEIQIIFLKSII